MARIIDNGILKNICGKLGQFIVRHRGDKAFISTRPKAKQKSEIPLAQVENQEKFKAASKYAREAMKDEDLKARYVAMAQPGKTAYGLAFSDAYHGPVISDLQTDNYHGKVGNKIQVRVTDNFCVAGVWFLVYDGKGDLLEDGLAIAAPNGIDWDYQVTRTNNHLPGTNIWVGAMDLAKNYSQLDKTL